MGYKEKWNPVLVCILRVGFIETFMSPYFELVFFLGFMLKKNSQIFVHFFMGYKEKVTFFFVCIFYRLVYKKKHSYPLVFRVSFGIHVKEKQPDFLFFMGYKEKVTFKEKLNLFLFMFYWWVNKNIQPLFVYVLLVDQ